jgi:hypothetical protein
LSLAWKTAVISRYSRACRGARPGARPLRPPCATLKEALAVYIETLAANGDPIPETTALDGSVSLGVTLRANVAV